jgi:hypothetical protein
MLDFLTKKAVRELEQKMQLCDSFISKEIDAEFYSKEKVRCQEDIKALKKRRKLVLGVGAGISLVVLFGLLFILIYYILRQLI